MQTSGLVLSSFLPSSLFCNDARLSPNPLGQPIALSLFDVGPHLWSVVSCQFTHALVHTHACLQAADDLKTQLEELMKERADQFDHMIQSEAKIRLDEAGWKERCGGEGGVWGRGVDPVDV